MLFGMLLCLLGLAWGGTTQERADQLLEEAVQNSSEARYEDAIRRFKEALILNKNALPARYGMVHAYLTTGRTQKAVRHLRRIRSRHGVSPEYYQLYGQAAWSRNHQRRAQGLFQKGIDMFPDTGTLYFYLGQLHAEASQMDRALKVWHQGISAEPSYPGNYQMAAHLLQRQSKWFWAWMHFETYLNLTAHLATRSIEADIQHLEQSIFLLENNALDDVQPVVCLQKDVRGNALFDSFDSVDTELEAEFSVALEVAATLHLDDTPEWVSRGYSDAESVGLRSLMGRIWTRSPQQRNVDAALFTWWAMLDRYELLPIYVEWLKHGSFTPDSGIENPEEWMRLKSFFEDQAFQVPQALVPQSDGED